MNTEETIVDKAQDVAAEGTEAVAGGVEKVGDVAEAGLDKAKDVAGDVADKAAEAGKSLLSGAADLFGKAKDAVVAGAENLTNKDLDGDGKVGN